MDSNIELLLFILFIAFSILSSIFDKKKKKRRNEQKKGIPVPQQKSEQVRAENNKEKSPEDLLREMFGLPQEQSDNNVRTETPRMPQEVEYTDDHISWNPEREFENVEVQSKPTYDHSSEKRELEKSKYSSFTGIGKDFKSIESSREIDLLTDEIAVMKRKAKKYSSVDFRKKLKQPESLRDYIVISEILQKPISLRK